MHVSWAGVRDDYEFWKMIDRWLFYWTSTSGLHGPDKKGPILKALTSRSLNVTGAGTCCLAIRSLMNLHKLSRISHQPRHWLQKTAATTQNSRQIINKLSLNYLVFLPLWRKHFSGVNLTASLGILVGGRLFLWQPWWYCGRIPSSSTRYGWTQDTRITSFLLTYKHSQGHWCLFMQLKYVVKYQICEKGHWLPTFELRVK